MTKAEQIEDLKQQGIELMAAARYDAAKDIFTRILELDNRYEEAYLHLGNAYVNTEMIDKAITCFDKALLLNEHSNEALYSMACAHFLKGESLEAIQYFNRCEENGFTSVEMYGIMSVIFLDIKDYNQSLRCLSRSIKLEPLNPLPRMDKARVYLTQGLYKEALNCLRELEEVLPDVGDAYALEADVLMTTGEPEAALDAIDKAVNRFPEDSFLLATKAKVQNNAGKYEDALKTISQAKEHFKDGKRLERDITLQESLAYAGLEKIDESIGVLEEAYEDDKADEEMLFFLMNECFATNRFEKSLETAEKLLEMEDVQPRFQAAALYSQASSIKALGREEEALEMYKELVGVFRRITIANPGLLDVYIYRLLALKELERYDEAIDIADHIISLAPESAIGYAFKSEVYKAKGDTQATEEFMKKTLALDPNFKF